MKELEKYLAELPAQIEATAHQTLLDAGKLGEETARNTKLFKNRALKAATNFHATGKLSGFVLADKPYAGYLEDGNPYKGFKITPKQPGGVLHFKIDGKDIFVKSSTAHGPLPFMQQAQDKVEGEIENIFNRNFDKFVGR